MHRRRLLAAAAVAAGAGCLEGVPGGTPTPAGGLTNPGFEDGLAGWEVGRDLPTDPNTGEPVETRVRSTDERASEGSRSAELFVDGRQDDGTLWLQQPADLAGVGTLSVDVYSPEESFNTLTKVAAYAGPPPKGGTLGEADFDTSRPVEDHAGWKTYDYPLDHGGAGLVAVGVSVVWETEVTRYLDAVALG